MSGLPLFLLVHCLLNNLSLAAEAEFLAKIKDLIRSKYKDKIREGDKEVLRKDPYSLQVKEEYRYIPNRKQHQEDDAEQEVGCVFPQGRAKRER